MNENRHSLGRYMWGVVLRYALIRHVNQTVSFPTTETAKMVMATQAKVVIEIGTFFPAGQKQA